MTRNLVMILGDQLSRDIAGLDDFDPAQDRILMAELRDEATYVRHHKKKIAFLFSAMRHFAAELKADGFAVDYFKYDNEGTGNSVTDVVRSVVAERKPGNVVLTHPGEWRLLKEFQVLSDTLPVPVEIRDDRRFFCTIDAFQEWADGRKSMLMEQFYRRMRKQTGFLMDDGKPLGGRWNFDEENRKPASTDLPFPGPARFEPDHITREVLELVANRFADHFGSLEDFWFAVTRKDARSALRHFIDHSLADFGDYQDAMLLDERYLYHSVLSLYINCGLLSPLEVCQAVLDAHKDRDLPLNAVEGFIRQMIGWREFVRGIYWLLMPGYRDRNYLDAQRDLPDFYWTGKTGMACLAATIGQTRDDAYAHHIQRLMITGNFALLAGINPVKVHEWYLAVYADAYEWVELPNTYGMSQFSDGGELATKPYASGGNFINKMSNYCGGCHYDVKERTGKKACPFNYLYWDFLARNEHKLGGVRRLAMPYRTWEKMASKRKQSIRQSANAFFDRLYSGDV